MHELQQILLQKLPRLCELTFGCVVKKKDLLCKVIARMETEDYSEFILSKGIHLKKKYLHDNIFIGRIYPEDEILGHPFSHSDLLEALGEDWAMLSNGQLVMVDDNDYFVPCYFDGMRDVFYPKLPSNISDLSLPEYQETRKQLISLLK